MADPVRTPLLGVSGKSRSGPTDGGDSSINAAAIPSRRRSKSSRHLRVTSNRYRVKPPRGLKRRSTDLLESLIGEADLAAGKRAGRPGALEKWEFPGWGVQRAVNSYDERQVPDEDEAHEIKLDQFRATAICGNDITSSCLYVAGLCTASAGKMAPVCLMVVAFLLYLFRGIYGEVVTALPVNGGAYNVLLNTTSKTIASLAACLTLLSYVATGVVSGTDAAIYAKTLWEELNVEIATICLLGFFALLVIWGISDSANVALVMFVGHLTTLLVLIGFCIAYAVKHHDIVADNWHSDFPDIVAGGETIASGNAATALFFGVSSALLGISGFETSANFVEEQAPGVFVKTLRNMWVAVAFFNPVLSLLSLLVMPIDDIYTHQGALLARMGEVTGGSFLRIWVAIDATVVLSGAVLTSFVGVTGLVRRMAMDRCLPQFLLNENSCRKTNHWIVIGFFLVSTSLFLMLRGNVETLSGVYNLAFLAVMSLFAIGCMMLKWKRPKIPRAVRSSYGIIATALTLVWLGLLGNVLRNPKVVQYFVLYFACTTLVVFIMFQRIRILRVMLHASKFIIHNAFQCSKKIESSLTKSLIEIHRNPIVFFAKGSRLTTLNKAVLYVKANEQTHRLCFVHVCKDGDALDPELRKNVHLLDSIYPKLRIDLIVVYGTFGPKVIKWLAKELGIPTNMMFIACPDEKFPFKFDSLGGVRVITNEHARDAPPALPPLVRAHSNTGDGTDDLHLSAAFVSTDSSGKPRNAYDRTITTSISLGQPPAGLGAGAGAGVGASTPLSPGAFSTITDGGGPGSPVHTVVAMASPGDMETKTD